jgi:hypothetical protein
MTLNITNDRRQFYNGQRKTILHELKKDPHLQHILYFKVFTVDSYQGEENDIIMLSLVRSNLSMNIGFLENKNRLVVALSRARRGLYIYGNAVTLVSGEESEKYVGREPLWGPLIYHMKEKDCYRFCKDGGLPVYCARHNKWSNIEHADHWVEWTGGCRQRCEGTLDCGHPCVYLCHPFDHSTVSCTEECQLILRCGHKCSKKCGENCRCSDASCLHSETIELQEVTYAEVASGPRINLNIRLLKDDGYSDVGRPQDSSSRIFGSHGHNYSLSSDLEKVRAWNSWDGKLHDAAIIGRFPTSATKEIRHDEPGHIFKEDFKPVVIDSEKRRLKGRVTSKRTLDNAKSVELIRAKKGVSFTEVEVDGQLPANKVALLSTMLSSPQDNQLGSEEDIYDASPKLAAALKDNYSTIFEWEVPESSRALVSNLQSATATTSVPQTSSVDESFNLATDQAPLEDDFDLLSFEEPDAPVPASIQAADFDMFEAQFG